MMSWRYADWSSGNLYYRPAPKGNLKPLCTHQTGLITRALAENRQITPAIQMRENGFIRNRLTCYVLKKVISIKSL